MNVNSLCRLQTVILAAGFSTRLGRPKALVRVHGVSLLRRALTTAAAIGVQITVVIPRSAAQYRREARGIRVTWAVNRRRAEGLSSSVRLGILSARRSSGILIMPADLADLRVRDLLRLVHRWRAAPRRLAARRIDRSAAIPVILPRRLYGEALRIGGNAGLRDFIRGLPADELVLIDLPSAAADVDTPADLRSVKRRFRSQPD